MFRGVVTPRWIITTSAKVTRNYEGTWEMALKQPLKVYCSISRFYHWKNYARLMAGQKFARKVL